MKAKAPTREREGREVENSLQLNTTTGPETLQPIGAFAKAAIVALAARQMIPASIAHQAIRALGLRGA